MASAPERFSQTDTVRIEGIGVYILLRCSMQSRYSHPISTVRGGVRLDDIRSINPSIDAMNDLVEFCLALLPK